VVVCRHTEDPVLFPDGTRVLASGWLERSRSGETVEVACVGGHGRTGTVLACMAILAGVPALDAVEWVRSTCCRRAVQEPAQQYWIERWAERHAAG
jgi:protein-tyrosine phosphatase